MTLATVVIVVAGGTVVTAIMSTMSMRLLLLVLGMAPLRKKVDQLLTLSQMGGRSGHV